VPLLELRYKVLIFSVLGAGVGVAGDANLTGCATSRPGIGQLSRLDPLTSATRAEKLLANARMPVLMPITCNWTESRTFWFRIWRIYLI
jgi:hypothetical protein